MDYFKISGKQNKSDIRLGQYKQIIHEQLKTDESIVLYYDSAEETSAPILYLEGYIFVADSLKKVLALYESNIKFRQVIFLESVQKESNSYWLVELVPLECSGPSTKLGWDGSIKELTLNESMVKGQDVFMVSMVKGANNHYIKRSLIVSLSVCESILRRKIIGIDYEPVKVEEGE